MMKLVPTVGAELAHRDDYGGRTTTDETELMARISEEIRAESFEISLTLVMDLLRPALQISSHDHAMIALALSPTEFVDPLSGHEVAVLACALYQEHLGQAVDYNDVLKLTERFRGRAMNTTMVYHTFRALKQRGLINERGKEFDEKTERLSRTFAINELGKEAFRLAILNADQLRRSAAA